MLRRLRLNSNGNYAVKRRRDRTWRSIYRTISTINRRACRRNGLDKVTNNGIIILTLLAGTPGGRNGQSPGCQVPVSAEARHTQSPPATCVGRSVPGQRVLRSARPRAGEVRDAPPRASRRDGRDRSRRDLRLLTSFLLSGSIAVPARRIGRFDPETTWSPACPQAVGRSPGLSPAATGPARIAACAGTVPTGPDEVRPVGASPQYRASFTPPDKKGALVAAPAPLPEVPASPGDSIGRYEDLRARVMQEAGRLPRGPGVTLFVRQGLAAWMQAWPDEASRPASPPAARAPTQLPAGLYADITQLLVDMIFHHRQETLA